MKELLLFAAMLTAAAPHCAAGTGADGGFPGLNAMDAATVSQASQAVFPRPAQAMQPLAAGEIKAYKAYKSEALPASSPLRGKAERTNAVWADENIMNGVAHVLSGRLLLEGKPVKERLTATSISLIQSYFKNYDEQTLTAPVLAETDLSLNQALDRAALNIAKGFFYDTGNPANIRPLRALIARLANWAPGEITPFSASSTAIIKGTSEDPLEVGLVIFLNPRTGEYLAFYSREGNG